MCKAWQTAMKSSLSYLSVLEHVTIYTFAQASCPTERTGHNLERTVRFCVSCIVDLKYLFDIIPLEWKKIMHFPRPCVCAPWNVVLVHVGSSEKLPFDSPPWLQTDTCFLWSGSPHWRAAFFTERETAGLDRLSGVKGASGSRKINWSPIYFSVNPPIKSYRRNFNFLWPWNCCAAKPASLIYDIFPEIWCIRNELCYIPRGLDSVNWFNHTNWMAVATLTFHPASVLNRCVVDLCRFM